jgi:hypothetical protein
VQKALPEIGEDMSRIALVVPSNTETKVAATLSQIKASLGSVPNVFALLANAPVALDGYLSLSKALSRCLSAHTALAQATGLSAADALKARFGKSDDPFERALTSFAKSITRQRGLVSDQELELARKVGIDDELMLEIVANVALQTLTNYANRLADTEIDSPVVEVSR